VAQRPEPGQDDLRGFDWRVLWHRAQLDENVETLQPHEGLLMAMALSPDGKLLVTSSWTSRPPQRVVLWDVATRREIGTLPGIKDPVGSLAFSHDGKLLLTSGFSQAV